MWRCVEARRHISTGRVGGQPADSCSRRRNWKRHNSNERSRRVRATLIAAAVVCSALTISQCPAKRSRTSSRLEARGPNVGDESKHLEYAAHIAPELKPVQGTLQSDCV